MGVGARGAAHLPAEEGERDPLCTQIPVTAGCWVRMRTCVLGLQLLNNSSAFLGLRAAVSACTRHGSAWAV